jgi:hypothetical protein
MNRTNSLKSWSAAAALAAVLPLATASPGFAQGYYYGQGYGPCTPPAGMAVGAAGPAMSGGQLMAGVGQCQSIASWNRGHYYRRPAAVAGWNGAYNYGGGGWYGGGWGGQGPGPYTQLSGRAVGPAGPAMSSGQWLAGVGQARPNWNGYNATGYAIGRPYYYGGPGYYDAPGNW